MTKVLVAAANEVVEGKLLSTKINGQLVIITRVFGKVTAVSGQCPHLGLPLAKGKVADGTVTCPFHGAKFDLSTGKNLVWANNAMGIPMPKWTHKFIALGKKPCDLHEFNVSEENGSVYITT